MYNFLAICRFFHHYVFLCTYYVKEHQMAKKHLVSMLPERERMQKLDTFLAVLDQHPSLAPFRARLRTGPERQLALLAALERAVIVGSPAANPPSPDDEADQLLCDILDVIDDHPTLKNHGAYYGPHRHLANLQALGLWSGAEPVNTPTARELFTTSFSNLTADPPSGLPSATTNNSPPLQDSHSGGELIGPSIGGEVTSDDGASSPQTQDSVLVVATLQDAGQSPEGQNSSGLIHHPAPNAGEQSADAPLDPRSIPALPVRRGRPVKLDDMAKGRLLGLMSFGLSFRQAAAHLGVHHVTLLNALKRDEEFAQQVSEARFDAISQPLLTVVQASRTSWRAAAWLAKFLEDRRARTYETTPEERELKALHRS
jgi:hypothetical protein